MLCTSHVISTLIMEASAAVSIPNIYLGFKIFYHYLLFWDNPTMYVYIVIMCAKKNKIYNLNTRLLQN